MPSSLADRALKNEALALHGGTPVRDNWLPYGHHSIDEGDIAAVIEVLRSDWITQGPKVDEFEQAVADCCGAKYGVALSSGTAALHAACAAAGLGPGDEVITTPLTFVATANAVVYCGAKPVFADVQVRTLNIDPEQVERRITAKTKAILPVDFAGQPANLDEIFDLARKHDLVVIEDACHALGAEYKGRKIGSVSLMTTFSFHPVKHVTTGEGGMVLTDDREVAQRVKSLRHHGIRYLDSQRPWVYEIPRLGYNYRLSDIHCALGRSQLRRLASGLSRRREIATAYTRSLSILDQVSLLEPSLDVQHAWHLYIILLNLEKLSADRDTVVEALRAENIGAALHYPLVYLHPFYRKCFGYGEGLCPIAEALAPRMVTLPMFPEMTDSDVDDVLAAMGKVLRCFSRKA